MHLLGTVIILFLTHCLGGVAAFGSTLMALPLLLWSGWDLRSAVAVLLIVGSAQAIHMAWLTWRGADIKALLRIILLAGLGIPFGFAAAEYLPRQTLGICLGAVLVAAGLSRLLEHWCRREWRPPAWALFFLLAAGGVIHGAFGSGGATLTVYARYALKEKSAFRGTLSVMWVILNAIVIGGLIIEGQVGRSVAVVALPGVPVILLATWLGHKLAERLSQERFLDLVSLLLVLAGTMTIARNLVA
jgi:uncharacterized membrane protein YfcA